MVPEDIADYLESVGPYVGGSNTYIVHSGRMQNSPDCTITVLDWPSTKMGSIRGMGSSASAPFFERTGCKVVIRGKPEVVLEPRTVAETVYAKLDFLKATINGRYYFVEGMHPPMVDEADRQGRILVEFNCWIEKARG